MNFRPSSAPHHLPSSTTTRAERLAGIDVCSAHEDRFLDRSVVHESARAKELGSPIASAPLSLSHEEHRVRDWRAGSTLVERAGVHEAATR